MVHLRIVAPPGNCKHVLDLLEDVETVHNIIHLKGVARKPEGDLIECDVARRDVSLLVADLRELDVDRDGSIAIDDIDSEISGIASESKRRARADIGSDPVVWENVSARTSENVELSHSFLAFMVLAMLIAAVGILTDQLILIIGAMVVGPEFGPIAALSVAAVQKRGILARRSFLALAVGFPLGITITFLATGALDLLGLIPEDFSQKGHPFTDFISSPDEFSVMVAFLAGMAGVLSLTNAKSGALVGVLISVTTIPAAANIGVAAALGDGHEWVGAMGQLALNMAAIFAACVGTLFVQRRLYVKRRRAHLQDESREAAGLPVGRSRRGPAPK